MQRHVTAWERRVLFLLPLVLVACAGAGPPPISASSPAPSSSLSPRPTATAAVTVPPPDRQATVPITPAVKHIFFVISENKEYSDIIGNPDAAYLNQLATRYAAPMPYYGIRHPSLPNYLAILGGHTYGVDTNCTDCLQDAPNLADSLEAKGLTWKSYQEDLPQPCYLGTDTKLYAQKHNPFAYFTDIRDDPARCNNIVPLSQLDADMASSTMPNFVWVTPNLINDMHDGSVADGDSWMARFVPKILDSDAFKDGGLLIILWEEGRTNHGCCDVAAGGRVPLLVVTPGGPPEYVSTAPATHYDLLRTIEDIWGLEHLGHSADAGVRALWAIQPGSASP